MGKFKREKADDLDLIKWQYIKSDQRYRECYDSIADLYEMAEDPILSDDFMKRRKLNPSLIPVIKDFVGYKLRKRLRIRLSPVEQEKWDDCKERLRDCWNLAYPVDYKEEMPKKLQFVRHAPVRRLLCGLPDKLLVEIDLSYTRKAIMDSLRTLVTEHQKHFKNTAPEKDTLRKLEMKVFAFEQRTYCEPPVPFNDIINALESKYPGETFQYKTVQKWVSDFRKNIEDKSYLRLK